VPFHVLHDGGEPCLGALGKLLRLSIAADIRSVIDVVSGPFFSSVPPARLLRGAWPLSARARLWRPGPLAALLGERAREWAALPPDAPLAVLDLGAGTGRNAVHLAERCGPASLVVAVDNRRVLCSRMARFAGREVGARGGRVACVGWGEAQPPRAGGEHGAPPVAPGAAGALFAVCADAEELIARLAAERGQPGRLEGAAAGGLPTAFDVVLFARFLHRGALAASTAALRDRGGLVCAETFRAGEAVDLPRDNLLAAGELREVCERGLRGGARSGWDCRTLYEGESATEDGRALHSSVVWAGPRADA
jgi:SAM-dependent methyltransferase